MFGIGTGELLLLLLIALIVLGPERMPSVARDVGRVLGDLRRTSDEFRDEFLDADRFLREPATKQAAEAPTERPAVGPETPAPDASGETTLDRELREARERLAESRKTS